MFRVVNLGADGAVGADYRALPAWDTDCRIPIRDFERQVSFLPLSRSRRVRAVARERAHGQLIATPGDDLAEHVSHERRGGGRHGRPQIKLTVNSLRRLYLMKTLKSLIHRLQIHQDDL